MSKYVKRLKSRRIYKKNLIELKQQEAGSKHRFAFGKPYPCLNDRFAESGVAKGHYFHQDLLVAQKVYDNKPSKHVDVGSRVDGLVAHIASFRQIEVLDVRPLSIELKNIRFKQYDIMTPLNDSMRDYTDSLSCLHALEHFGLGRYGDPVNYDGYLVAFNNLYAMLKQGGKFYFSVPIGPERIEFDAHRVFSIEYLLSMINGKYDIDSFSYVDDDEDLHENVDLSSPDVHDNFGCHYGCGIFELTKR